MTETAVPYYTPLQIVISTFIGGPIAGTWYLSKNYTFIGNGNMSLKVKLTGLLIFVIGLIVSYMVGSAPEHTTRFSDNFFSLRFWGILWLLSILGCYIWADYIRKKYAVIENADITFKGSTARLILGSILLVVISGVLFIFSTLIGYIFSFLTDLRNNCGNMCR